MLALHGCNLHVNVTNRIRLDSSLMKQRVSIVLYSLVDIFGGVALLLQEYVSLIRKVGETLVHKLMVAQPRTAGGARSRLRITRTYRRESWIG